MKKSIRSVFLDVVLLGVLLSGCAPASTPAPTALAAASTPEPAASAAPLTGSEVFPVDSLAKSKPWMPLDETARPATNYFLFNLAEPPFDNVLVRQAFAAAIDREAIAKIAEGHGEKNPRPATTFTPPETLGRDLYNAVGIPFDPAHAKQLLEQAGFADLSTLAPVILITNPGPDGLHGEMAEAMVGMWQTNLGVNATVEVISEKYFKRVQTDPGGLFWSGWAGDLNDPDNFLRENFHTGSEYNYNHFSNLVFDDLVDRAAAASDPAERQELYIQAERVLCEIEAALIPVYHTTYNIPAEPTAAASPAGLAPLFRLFENGKEHLYTTSQDEKDGLLQTGAWVDEGITGYLSTEQIPGTVPLFRLSNAINGKQFYTTNEAERDGQLQHPGWSDKGTIGFIATTQLPGTTPLFRFLNKTTDEHFYPVTQSERDGLLQSGAWIEEGITGYLWISGN
jgi:ABC-type transport system substrate-binding protein